MLRISAMMPPKCLPAALVVSYWDDQLLKPPVLALVGTPLLPQQSCTKCV